MSVAVFLLALGATARITRFINRDYLFRNVRAQAIRWTHDEHDVVYLLRCAWCASIWVGGGVYTLAYFYGHTGAFWIVCGALSASYIYGVIEPSLDPPDDA